MSDVEDALMKVRVEIRAYAITHPGKMLSMRELYDLAEQFAPKGA